MSKRIYMDHAATTPIHPIVWDAVAGIHDRAYGNPSSTHAEGRYARTIIEESRRIVAKFFRASLGEIFFTSCGTESNNMILLGAVRDLGVRRIITSPVEHHCVLHSIDYLAKQYPVEIIHLPVDSYGNADIETLDGLLSQSDSPKTLVSLMHVNNETGATHDLEKIGLICRQHGAYFHSDTVQSVGFQRMDLDALPVDFITGSAHKFYGPKGVGFVFIRSGLAIHPFLYGGSQERNMRAGTENILGIHGLAQAIALADDTLESRMKSIITIRDFIRTGLLELIPQLYFNGESPEGFSPKILSTNFPPGPRTELILMHLDIAGISASGGSACSSGAEQASHVLTHLAIPEGYHTVRFSFSPDNTIDEAETVLATVRKLYPN